MLREFKEFLAKTGALALAIGVIIGAAVSGVVSALVSDLMMPLLGMLLPAGGFREARIVLSRSTDATGKVTENAILYGHLLGTLLDFLVIASVVFLLVRALMRAMPPPPPEPVKQCPECLDSIPLAARRCRSCTAVLTS
ncbi:MAG: large conductance mechanosensitive channel protein MscL [Acidobacteriota bacterium]|nr:large conductance mechanosensitive channel protein MscL [Acidobacteriota bacterium]